MELDLFRGDCLEIMPQIPDGCVDLILCDPPYGTTACKWDSIIPFDKMWLELNRIIKPRNYLEFPYVKKSVHPTQKPVELLEYLIKTYTNEDELVLDFTMGSGSTGVACKTLNRNFIGIEMDDKYFEIAKKRILEDQ